MTHTPKPLACNAEVCYECRSLPVSRGVRLCETHRLNPAAYRQVVEELGEILQWAIEEKQPLRQQEIASIKKVLAAAQEGQP